MMKNFIPKSLSFTLPLFLFFALIIGCTKKREEAKIPITSASQEAVQHFLHGRDLFEKLRFQNSLEHFENAVSEDNNFALAYYYHALANPTTKGFFEDLQKTVSLANKVSEGEKLMIMAFQAGTNGDQKMQEEYLLKLIQLYPADERAHNLLGQFYFGQQNFNKAVEHLSKAVEIAPNFSLSYNMLGYSQRSLANYVEAENAFKKYIQLIPDDPNPYDSYAELLMKQGKYEESIEQYRKALSVDPNFAASFLGIACNYNYLGQHENAITELKAFYDKARNDGERGQALFGMTVSYVDQGNFDKAMEALQEQYELNMKNNDAGGITGNFTAMGNILLGFDRYDEALKKYEQALNVTLESNLSNEIKENTKRQYLYNAAKVFLMKNNIKKAKETAAEFETKANAANNTFQIWLSHELLGLIALKEKDYTKSESEFKLANQQNPNTYYNLGLVYQAMGNKEKADQQFKLAYNFNALTNLNQAFVRMKTKKMAM